MLSWGTCSIYPFVRLQSAQVRGLRVSKGLIKEPPSLTVGLLTLFMASARTRGILIFCMWIIQPGRTREDAQKLLLCLHLRDPLNDSRLARRTTASTAPATLKLSSIC